MSKIVASASTNASPTAKMSAASLIQRSERAPARTPISNTTRDVAAPMNTGKLPGLLHAVRGTREKGHPQGSSDGRADGAQQPARLGTLVAHHRPQGDAQHRQRRDKGRNPRRVAARLELREHRADAQPEYQRTHQAAGAGYARAEEKDGQRGGRKGPVHQQPGGYQVEARQFRAHRERRPAEAGGQHQAVEPVVQPHQGSRGRESSARHRPAARGTADSRTARRAIRARMRR